MCYALKSHNAIRLLSYQTKKTREKKQQNVDSVRAEHNTTATSSNPTPNENAHASMSLVKDTKKYQRDGERTRKRSSNNSLFIYNAGHLRHVERRIFNRNAAFSPVCVSAAANHMVFSACAFLHCYFWFDSKETKNLNRIKETNQLFTAETQKTVIVFSQCILRTRPMCSWCDEFMITEDKQQQQQSRWRRCTNNRIKRMHRETKIPFLPLFRKVHTIRSSQRFMDFDNVYRTDCKNLTLLLAESQIDSFFIHCHIKMHSTVS